jgi:hypothetical protein
VLEGQLERIDLEETAALFLGSSRCDGNTERNAVLSDIDTALADYGAPYSLKYIKTTPFNKHCRCISRKESSNAQL